MTDNSQYNRGSEWRKWDLHIHSLHSHLGNNYNGISPDDFIKKIKQENIEVVGLTNYFNFTDEDFKLKEKLEKNGITVFLNLEIRLAYQNKEDDCCDAHIILDNRVAKENVENFLTKLNVTDRGTEKIAKNLKEAEEFNKATIEFDHLLEVLNQESLNLTDKYLMGFLSRGHGNSRSSSNYEKIARKSHFLIHSSNKVENVEEDRNFWLGKDKPLLQSSDAHKKDTIGTKFTWIKADKTFEGLKQIIYEPAERVVIQSIEPQKVSDSYRIDKITYSVNGKQKTLAINPYLNSVIGVRASGKSILLKNIAYKIDTEEYNKKTNDGKPLAIDNFKVVWADGEKNSGTNESKTILYIPQNFLSKLVHSSTTAKNELENFIKELFERNTIFKSKLSIWETSNQQLDKKIYDILSNLFDFDFKLNKVKDSIKKEGLGSDVSKNIKQIESNIEKVKNESKLTEKVLNEYKTNKNNAAKYVVDLESINQDIDSLKYLLDTGLVNLDIIDELKFSPETEKKITNNLIEKRDDVVIFIKKEITTLETKSKKVIKDIETLRGKIKPVEDKMKKGSLIKDLADQLSENKNKLLRIEKLNTEQKELLNKILVAKKSVLDLFSGREKLTDAIIKDFKDFGEAFEFIAIKIDRHFKEDEFIEFCKKINFHSKSVFKENKDTYKKAYDFLSKDEIKNIKDVYDIIADLFVNIFDENLPLTVGNDKRTFLLQLVSNWYDINYKDSVLNKDDDTKLLDMSDGQKMNALLELLFSFDDYSFPILIDQPEDDLDVTAITEMVVKFIKDKKKQRQIMLVSHNANLVIGSDTENVVISEKKIRYRKIQGFEYENGAIENNEIKSNIIRILEGGKEAFRKRGQKLGII